uniref:Protein kinase domain-containing protein n=1 Tax=Heterorhabditis bacteriophora TaxID=37862 RepID=A0A1I7XHH7_HETBA
MQSNILTIDTKERSPSPGPRSPHRTKPGTKSPVLLSPGKEHSIEVIIATKRGKLGFLPPGEDAKEINDDDAKMDERKKKVKPSTHKEEFRDLRDDLERDNSRRNVKLIRDVSDLDKYRPGNFYKENVELDLPSYDIDDSPWDSHYQIGPDTYLMATRGPSFNSRVRDYRRKLWGDGAPLVQEGILGYRNQDVTVRERRRYTDIIREQQIGIRPESNEKATSLHSLSTNAIDRIKADIEKVAPSATKRNADGTFAPIFKSRMRDAYLKNSSAVFECEVSGSPVPNILWTFQGKQIENDGHHTLEQSSSISRLVLNHPTPLDLGEYTCTATNEFGMDRTTSRLISGEAPSRPGRPECELSSDTELFITWDPPEGPTYFEGIIYRLEYRIAGPNDHLAPWIIISEDVDDEAVVLRHLEPLGVYQFRVTARNGFGSSKLHVDSLKSEYRLNILAVPQRTASHQLQGISEEIEDESTMLVDLTLHNEDPFKRFQIDAPLFKGRFSVIRQAVDSRTESRSHCVAKIKYIGENHHNVLKEFETLKDVQHENVFHLISAYMRNDFLYLFGERLFEDVFGRFTFNDYYTEEQISMTIRQLTSALHWIHFRGLFSSNLAMLFHKSWQLQKVLLYISFTLVIPTILSHLTNKLLWYLITRLFVLLPILIVSYYKILQNNTILLYSRIVHLAVNPHNVMFQSKRNWIVKLIGFGSAQFLEEAKKPTDFDMQWAPPEFYISEDKVTIQSDMWGLGIITFCLLGGFHPFTSEYDKLEEIKENVLNVKCDPNLIPTNASHESLSFVTWALKKSPLRRMRTDEALGHRFLSSEPSFIRRRESIKYPSSRLRKTALLTKQNQERPISNELELKYGGEVVRD